jgi:hypothetical protein
MWKANGKTTTLSLFLDSLFPKTEIPCMRDPWKQERILSFEEEALDRIKWRNRLEEAVDLSSDRLLTMMMMMMMI